MLGNGGFQEVTCGFMGYYQGYPEGDRGGVGWGFLLGVGLNLLQGALLWLIVATESGDASLAAMIFGLGGWGIIQLVYVVPIYFYLRSRNKSGTAKGLVIAASIVLLINVGCWATIGMGR